ncbi:MAG: response regulator receiver protein [Rariglobus sp.]|jgi:CheY-like chemotaxis protein|nr:response regulator receiver protein [Rariglobus sp.]
MKNANPTILVVDDDPNDLLLIKMAFKAVGVTSRIQTADSGHEAVAYLKGEGKYADRRDHPYPDFVLTDLKMPGLDGFAVLEHLKKNPESAIIPTVILSGSQDNDDIKKAYLLGASSYHVKPSSPGELRVLVKVLHDYWVLCEAPAVDVHGKQIATDSSHKLGERFSLNAR